MKTKTNIPKELAAMKKMTAVQLRVKHRELFGEDSRSGNRQWLFRRCAWRLQALAEGDLSQRARRRAKHLARDVDIRLRPPAEMNMPPMDRPADVRRSARKYIRRNLDARLPMPGTRLQRDYKGHTYEVEVLDNGFAYDGEVYQSLSAVATAITGGHWNGYLFFNLKDPSKENE
ncbi:MAG: DUF2924 domain-containing protein [Phycisphaerae bacterium]|nr:DUF2924 domain-containing protein [Phycisphaerae bacterium]